MNTEKVTHQNQDKIFGEKRSGITAPREGQKELSEILDEIEERSNKATPEPWESMYLKHYCLSDHNAGGGLHALTIGKCSRGDGDCNGHDNENWSRLAGPDTYREHPDGPEYLFSNDADFIASSRTDVPNLVKGHREARTRYYDSVGGDPKLMAEYDAALAAILAQTK